MGSELGGADPPSQLVPADQSGSEELPVHTNGATAALATGTTTSAKLAAMVSRHSTRGARAQPLIPPNRETAAHSIDLTAPP